MENVIVQEVEDDVRALIPILVDFRDVVKKKRTSDNYNHLGTLAVNLTVLVCEARELINEIGIEV